MDELKVTLSNFRQIAILEDDEDFINELDEDKELQDK